MAVSARNVRMTDPLVETAGLAFGSTFLNILTDFGRFRPPGNVRADIFGRKTPNLGTFRGLNRCYSIETDVLVVTIG